MPNTKANLAPATITNLDTSEVVHCMFNPHEYTLKKSNNYTPDEVKGLNVPKIKFTQGGAQSLDLQLFFDTFAEGSDVREHTAGLWRMMMISPLKLNPLSGKGEPPQVAFHWGSLYFRAVIMSLSQKFTLFSKDGTPLRTTVDVSFQQVADDLNYLRQNPTSGGGPAMKTHLVQAGDRLDLIAAKIYGDPTQWRLIAHENGLVHPLRLRNGQQLVIPPLV